MVARSKGYGFGNLFFLSTAHQTYADYLKPKNIIRFYAFIFLNENVFLIIKVLLINSRVVDVNEYNEPK